MKNCLLVLLISILLTTASWAGRARIETITDNPYVSAMVVDAENGQVLFEENGNASIYPASVLKMMVLLLVLEQIEQGKHTLDEMVQVTNEAARMGGSQVYLDPSEQFSVENLLYALAIQSANDAAVALAVHTAGSKAAFVSLMNQRAQELGMLNTRFHSVHGLPPAEGQLPDRTTARDLVLLFRELASRPETFTYTGTRERAFRDGAFMMRTHNHLLNQVVGCDGFKTGYFRAAGFSIAATAKRDGVRLIVLVLGSEDRHVRDAKAAELLAKGFAMVPPKPAKAVQVVDGAPVQKPKQVADTGAQQAHARETEETSETSRQQTTKDQADGKVGIFFYGFFAGLIPSLLLVFLRGRRRPKRNRRIS